MTQISETLTPASIIARTQSRSMRRILDNIAALDLTDNLLELELQGYTVIPGGLSEERIERALVTFDIFREFGLPKCLVRLRHRGKPASSVPVPVRSWSNGAW